MKSLLFLPALLILAPAIAQQPNSETAPARPLDALLAGDAVWQMTADQFQEQFKAARFDWLSEKRDQARFFGPGLSLWEGGIKLNEAIIEFSPEGSPARMTFSIFNRGDSGELPGSREQFETQINTLRETVSKRLGVTATERGKDKTSAVAAEGFVWMKPPTA